MFIRGWVGGMVGGCGRGRTDRVMLMLVVGVVAVAMAPSSRGGDRTFPARPLMAAAPNSPSVTADRTAYICMMRPSAIHVAIGQWHWQRRPADAFRLLRGNLPMSDEYDRQMSSL